jgi:glutamine synthetase
MQDPSGTIDEIMKVANLIRMPLESVNSEYDDGQFELTLRYTNALTAADDAFLFKQMAREIAANKGMLLTFLGKPHSDRGGSGLHVNFSLLDGSGFNALADPVSEDGLSDLARQCIAGLIDKHRSMAALLAPTVNSYKRLQPGQLAGCWANWGYDHRGVTVRIPPTRGASTRIEHRMADCAVSPHVAVAAVLTAALLGAKKELQPPPEETLDCLENVGTDVRVPADLGAALDALAADTEFVEAFSPAYVDGFLTVKRAEWERFNKWTTDWELNEYLPYY